MKRRRRKKGRGRRTKGRSGRKEGKNIHPCNGRQMDSASEGTIRGRDERDREGVCVCVCLICVFGIPRVEGCWRNRQKGLFLVSPPPRQLAFQGWAWNLLQLLNLNPLVRQLGLLQGFAFALEVKTNEKSCHLTPFSVCVHLSLSLSHSLSVCVCVLVCVRNLHPLC